MPDPRPFRFGMTSWQATRPEILAEACRAQAVGYDIFLAPEHWGQMGAIPLLTMVADHVPAMRVGTYVLTSDFHHPVVMARDAATLDVFSDGRLELGLGGGYMSPEYETAGIPFQSARVRFERLTETVRIAKLAFAGHTFSFAGAHYQVRDYEPYPPPVQRPGPPLLLGGGGPRLLSFAAAEADIVGITPPSVPGGRARATGMSLQSCKKQAAWVRETAGARWGDLELNVPILGGIVSADRRAAAATYLDDLYQRLEMLVPDGEVSVDDLLDSPYLAFGTAEDMAEHLLRVREETGVSYFGVMGHLLDAFEPVIDRLGNSAQDYRGQSS